MNGTCGGRGRTPAAMSNSLFYKVFFTYAAHRHLANKPTDEWVEKINSTALDDTAHIFPN